MVHTKIISKVKRNGLNVKTDVESVDRVYSVDQTVSDEGGRVEMVNFKDVARSQHRNAECTGGGAQI